MMSDLAHWRKAFRSLDRIEAYTPAAGTLPYLVLQVARSFNRSFSFEELTIAAWQADPRKAGMKQFPEHPDTNRVKCAIVGKRGLVQRGFLRQLTPNYYEVI